MNRRTLFSHLEEAGSPAEQPLTELPPQWLICREYPWFALTVRALYHPEAARKQALLQRVGWPLMPPQVWLWAVSAFMLALKYTCPTPVLHTTDAVWQQFEEFLEKNEFEK